MGMRENFNMKKVLVLLSAYNGKKYLPEQLDSLLGQEGVEVAYTNQR
jgi:glycosyltransferase involved in cell wall biosynthesis